MTEMISPTILWAIAGILLLVVEMATMTFFLVFFAVAALVVAVAKAFGLDHFATEMILFSGIGASGLLFFRKRMLRMFVSEQNELETDTSQVLTLTSDIAPEGTALVEYQGSQWTAINESPVPLRSGDRVVIVRTEGVKLVVKPN